jgi:hypothetical protein
MQWTIGDAADLEVSADDKIENAVEREIEAIGVKYQIATRRTSWVAVDEAGRVDGPGVHEVMPQALPYGTSAEGLGLRPGGERRIIQQVASAFRALSPEELARRRAADAAAAAPTRSRSKARVIQLGDDAADAGSPRSWSKTLALLDEELSEDDEDDGRVRSKTTVQAFSKPPQPAEPDGVTLMSAPEAEPDPARRERRGRDAQELGLSAPAESAATAGARWRVWLRTLIYIAIAALLAWLLTR